MLFAVPPKEVDLQTATQTKPKQRFTATYQQEIAGRYRRITTHQIIMMWWLYRAGHITLRQLRIIFAAHEMAEQRSYTPADDRRKPLYRREEILHLVGGRGSKSAARAISRDVQHLGSLGVAMISDHSITFADSIEQIHVDDVSGFWEMFQQIKNSRRKVPVPRRTLRALAGGFRRSETGYMLMALIRSVFWHKDQEAYRIDGRMKLSELATTFMLDRKSVSSARTHLIELGWLIPYTNTPQQMINRFGVHDVINVDWEPANDAELSTETVDQPVHEAVEKTDMPTVGGRGDVARFPSPPPDSVARFPSPYKQVSSSSRNQNKKLRSTAPEPSVVSIKPEGGSRKKEAYRDRQAANKPNIHRILPEHLRSPYTLHELYRQAVATNLISDCEGWKSSFFAMANRARTRGHNPGALLLWLIKQRKHEFVTLADEEAAKAQLRRLDGEPVTRELGKPISSPPTMGGWLQSLPESEQFVHGCIVTARMHKGIEPFRVAQAKGWDRDQWDQAYWQYQAAQAKRQCG